MSKFLTMLSCLVIMIFGSAMLTYAAPSETGLFIGIGGGDASLNQDLYIYSSEANARQPELNIRESNDYSGPARSFFVGYNFSNQKTNFLGSDALQLGIQLGHTDFGEYTITTQYNSLINPTGYRKVEEEVIDVLLTSNLYWENGFNLFAKAGIARLSGKYEQAGLLSPRQPEFVPSKQALSIVAYRPELVVGAGYLITDHCNLYFQYGVVFGGKPSTGDDRFNNSDMVELPNTLYQVDSFTMGVTWHF